MKLIAAFSTMLLLLLPHYLLAQTNNCMYKDPVFSLDFGTDTRNEVPVLYNLEHYKINNDPCPKDGFYSFASASGTCFEGRWHHISEDHTPGDVNGKMMIVNGDEKPGDFFVMTVTGLTPGARYRISSWFTNIYKFTTGCVAKPPIIEITVLANNKVLGSFNTGEIKASDIAVWQNYTGEFVMVSNTDVISLHMKDLTAGGCGNDFALDDIEINKCSLPMPKNEMDNKQQAVQSFVNIPIPTVIEKRANPVIKQISTEETELKIEVYDNGEIDGDTVSIYHNNELVVSHAGISTKPVSLKLKVDKEHPHHELVMVADNLGRIPPNTSLMIITAGKNRYEIFISSSEQKNAKILIDLQ